jgi:hypothetical protein
MATWASLTADQQAAIQAVATPSRGMAGTLAQLLNHAKDIGLAYSGSVEALIGSLNSGEIIPNNSGLAGASGLTRDQLINLLGYYIVMGATLDGSNGSYNTNYHRGLYIAAAGINAIVS